MPRRPRRSGIHYVENDTARSLTLIKRSEGLSKSAADLSTLTGAKVAIVVESENGKMYGFGTPSASSVIDCFLSGNTPIYPFPNEQQNNNITSLQNKVFKLEKKMAEEEKRSQESKARTEEVQESSRMAKLIIDGKVEDASVDEVNELLKGLSMIHQEIKDQLPQSLKHGYKLEIGGSGDPSVHLPSQQHSQMQLAPGSSSWTPLQQSLQAPRLSGLLPQLSCPRPSLLNPMMLPSSPQVPPSQMLQDTHASQGPSWVVPPQAYMVPGAHKYNYHPLALGINGGAGGNNYIAGRSFANYQWPSPICYGAVIPPSFHGPNVYYLGNSGSYGRQAAGGQDTPGPSNVHQRPFFDFLNVNSSESSSKEENPGNNDGAGV